MQKIDRRTAIKSAFLVGSMAMINPRAMADCITTSDIEGPFYIPNQPVRDKLSPASAAGTPLFITGTVYANDCKTPLPNALVDVWHASDAGDYDNEGSDYRGRIRADGSGQYAYETILPGKYLNGSQFRPRHLHYKVSGAGELLTTQIYFKGDTSIENDPWASAPEAADRIIALDMDTENRQHGVVDIFLDVDPTQVGVQEQLRKSSTHIRSVFPNPMRDKAVLEINLAKSAIVDLLVYSLAGQVVAKPLVEMAMQSGKHQVALSRNSGLGTDLPAGIYVCRLTVNGKPLSAKRFLITD